jgi:RND family efflux transporter MFP subunit
MQATDDPKAYEPRRSGLRYVIGWVCAVVLAAAASGGLVLARESRLAGQRTQLEQRLALGPRVLVTPVKYSPRARDINLPANVRGYIETPVYAKIAGYLKTIRVDKGDRARKGEVIAILESPEIDKQVSDARASYWLQKVTDDRNQSLVRSGVIPQQTADDSHAAMLQARDSYEQLRAMQAYEVIRAPYDGFVTARYVDPGALIPQVTSPSSGATPIISMATLRPVRVYADVPQNLAPFIKDGDPAELTVADYPRRVFEGTVTRHPHALVTDTRTMLVEVDLPNKDLALYPGMYGTLKLKVSVPEGVPMVPDDALVFRNGKVYVPVVRNDRLYLTEVTLGYDNGLEVEIRSGISGHAMVAINVGQTARDGEPVRPVVLAAER